MIQVSRAAPAKPKISLPFLLVVHPETGSVTMKKAAEHGAAGEQLEEPDPAKLLRDQRGQNTAASKRTAPR
jgi:hypothetical protein